MSEPRVARLTGETFRGSPIRRPGCSHRSGTLGRWPFGPTSSSAQRMRCQRSRVLRCGVIERRVASSIARASSSLTFAARSRAAWTLLAR